MIDNTASCCSLKKAESLQPQAVTVHDRVDDVGLNQSLGSSVLCSVISCGHSLSLCACEVYYLLCKYQHEPLRRLSTPCISSLPHPETSTKAILRHTCGDSHCDGSMPSLRCKSFRIVSGYEKLARAGVMDLDLDWSAVCIDDRLGTSPCL